MRPGSLFVAVTATLLACAPGTAQRSDDLASIRLPPGFAISMYAHDVPGARSMTVSPAGIVYVGTREGGDGSVYALVDGDRDGTADRVVTIARGLRQPNGVAWRDGSLYVAEVNRIVRYAGIDRFVTSGRLDDPPLATMVHSLPDTDHHEWRYIAFGPDGKLYVGLGAPCNVCEPEPPLAGIARMNADGSDFEAFASGVRNTVGFDWHPGTDELWFTDNGRDRLGDDVPADELDHAPRAGLHFGFPFCHQGDVPDPEFGEGRSCADFEPPALKLGAHVAALGMRFYEGAMFPAEYGGRIFIAQHGSWNRSSKVGYRIVSVRLEDGRAVAAEPFADGWLQGEEAWGRPVDVLVMPDGALLVSDDRAGAIYRITASDANRASE
ncbi:MAG TPA: sorbosone dehydrogenase family protein [Gemmatimonadota bacterium]|nr:sorbosone dehydrogenase family protein [Gemmatimonadota bacterium]